MANRNAKSLTSNKKQGKVSVKGAKTKKVVSQKSGIKTTPKRYKTQGTIANIDLMTCSFSIDPILPYVFEQKKNGIAEKSILFVSICGDNEDAGGILDSKIMKSDCMFSRPIGVDLNALIVLKNGGVKIEMEVELLGGENIKELALQSFKTVKA